MTSDFCRRRLRPPIFSDECFSVGGGSDRRSSQTSAFLYQAALSADLLRPASRGEAPRDNSLEQLSGGNLVDSARHDFTQ
jgi:hypothetical protein